MASINFFCEEIIYTLPNKRKIKSWIKDTVLAEGFQLNVINFIFCSDAYLLEINRQYLDHDTLTDIITFDNSQVEKQITSDIFISIERVKENSKTYKTVLYDEVCRIIIHGTLHLLNYGDKNSTDKAKMTLMENHYLSLRNIGL